MLIDLLVIPNEADGLFIMVPWTKTFSNASSIYIWKKYVNNKLII